MVLVAASSAAAQAPINSDVALQPPTGGVILRQQARFAHFDGDPSGAGRDADVWRFPTTVVYGLRDNLTPLIGVEYSF